MAGSGSVGSRRRVVNLSLLRVPASGSRAPGAFWFPLLWQSTCGVRRWETCMLATAAASALRCRRQAPPKLITSDAGGIRVSDFYVLLDSTTHQYRKRLKSEGATSRQARYDEATSFLVWHPPRSARWRAHVIERGIKRGDADGQSERGRISSTCKAIYLNFQGRCCKETRPKTLRTRAHAKIPSLPFVVRTRGDTRSTIPFERY